MINKTSNFSFKSYGNLVKTDQLDMAIAIRQAYILGAQTRVQIEAHIPYAYMFKASKLLKYVLFSSLDKYISKSENLKIGVKL